MHPPEARSRIHKEQQPCAFSMLAVQLSWAVQLFNLTSLKYDFQFAAPKDLDDLGIYPPVHQHLFLQYHSYSQ
jgi:hypothetical protein